jgi:hypothetical protein
MASTACADSNDFQTDSGGRLQLNPEGLQTALTTFARTIPGAANVYSEILTTEVSHLTVVVPGKYIVNWDAHANVVITSAAAGIGVSASASVAISLNHGGIIGGTETLCQTNIQGAAVTTEPALQLHGSGSGTRIMDLVAGDVISMYMSRNSDPGTTSEILSNGQGRTRITMWRIGSS